MKHKDFEEYLQMEHMKDYIGTDDDAPDAFNKWIEYLEIDDWLKYGDNYAIDKAMQSLDNVEKSIKERSNNGK